MFTSAGDPGWPARRAYAATPAISFFGDPVMNIPSTRTRHDMEIAADLRGQGRTWVTIGLKLKLQPGLLMRWTRFLRFLSPQQICSLP
jgi:hypothetical protein